MPLAARRAAVLPALACAALGRGAHAQRVRVQTDDAATGAPVVQAVVTLAADSAPGAPGLRVNGVTGPGGGRMFAVPPGRYRVEVRRVGQQPHMGPLVQVGVADTVRVTVRLPNRPVSLTAVQVRARRGCTTAAAPEVVALWGAARTAVGASAEPRPGLARAGARVLRRLDYRGRLIDEQRVVLPPDSVASLAFVSRPPAVAARDGFVDGVAWQRALFYGPDARVLLSEEFALTHCFAPARGAGAEAGWLGVRFTPVPGRGVPDIEGVVWLDSATAEPRRVDFEYRRVWLPAGAQGVGGDVRFARAPTGEWVAHRWRIRTPVLGRGLLLRGYREDIGELDLAPAPGDALRLVRVAGVVYDSLAGAPLAGAAVARDGDGPRARTDSAGRFALDSVPAAGGEFVVTHPGLEAAGLTAVRVVLDLAAARDGDTVRLAVPSRATFALGACAGAAAQVPNGPPGAAGARDLLVAFGVARDAGTGTAAPGAAVRLTWDATVRPGGPAPDILPPRATPTGVPGRMIVRAAPGDVGTFSADTRAGADGQYGFCLAGLAADARRFTLRAAAGPGDAPPTPEALDAATAVPIVPGARGVVRRDLTARRP